MTPENRCQLRATEMILPPVVAPLVAPTATENDIASSSSANSDKTDIATEIYAY